VQTCQFSNSKFLNVAMKLSLLLLLSSKVDPFHMTQSGMYLEIHISCTEFKMLVSLGYMNFVWNGE
jgi:hypothetical protein